MPTWAVRAPLARWLAAEAERAHRDLGTYRLLDVGCGEKPYGPLFAPFVSTHVGVDPVENPVAELRGPIEALPVDDGSFDVVLCAQVLEHVDDPSAAARELHRVLAPGGRLLLSTHGAMVFHPAPVDHWRWTHTGVARVLEREREWASVTVTPGCGTTASLTMLIAIYTEHALRRTPLRFARHRVVAGLNRVAETLDSRSAALRDMRPGTLTANYHVVAEKLR
ncbi:MAG: class I SAM-dependent methyltransferase [Gaiella sp.]